VSDTDFADTDFDADRPRDRRVMDAMKLLQAENARIHEARLSLKRQTASSRGPALASEAGQDGLHAAGELLPEVFPIVAAAQLGQVGLDGKT
jgi:hypothetical protein